MKAQITNLYRLVALAALASFCLYSPPTLAASSNDAAAGMVAIIMGLFFTVFFSLWFLWVALIVAINVGGVIVWVIMLIDCVQRKFPSENDKLMWVLVVALTGWIGALVYYFVIKRKEDN